LTLNQAVLAQTWVLGENITQNNAILINSTNFSKKVKKNSLKQPVEEKKRAKNEANREDLL